MKRERLIILSGAGVSAESGIQTFRDSNGLWENYRIEDVATPEAWKKDADLVTEFYNLRRKQVMIANPNEAHLFFAKLEDKFEVNIITQNIDDLHERAGSSSVLHLHGNIRFSKSSGPNSEKEYYPITGSDLKATDLCPEGFRLRPHVVWFGEDVPEMTHAIDLVSRADIIIVTGTSLNVYPAAGLMHYAPLGIKKAILDPNADKMQLPSDMVKIAATAVGGLKQVADFLGLE